MFLDSNALNLSQITYPALATTSMTTQKIELITCSYPHNHMTFIVFAAINQLINQSSDRRDKRSKRGRRDKGWDGYCQPVSQYTTYSTYLLYLHSYVHIVLYFLPLSVTYLPTYLVLFTMYLMYCSLIILYSL